MSFTQRQEDNNILKSGIRRSPPDLQQNQGKDPWVGGQGPHPVVLWFKNNLGDVHKYVEINMTWEIRAHMSTLVKWDASTTILIIFLF